MNIASSESLHSLQSLVRKDPYSVPGAAREFRRALKDHLISWKSMLPWVTFCVTCVTPDTTHTLYKVIRNLKTNEQWSSLMYLLLMYDIRISNVSSRVLTALHDVPQYHHDTLQRTLLLFLQEPYLRPAIVRDTLRLYHTVCQYPADLQALVKGGLVQYVGRVGYAEVAKEFVDLFMNPRMCMKAQKSTTPFAQALFSTKYMMMYYNQVVQNAKTTIGRFMEQSYRRMKIVEQKRQEVLVKHQHALNTLVVRWRWCQAWLLRQSCAVCWESGIRLAVLHGDRRHAICHACLEGVQCTGNRCPLCRKVLSHTPESVDESVISYNTDYEDPYYDDDQMYHYD